MNKEHVRLNLCTLVISPIEPECLGESFLNEVSDKTEGGHIIMHKTVHKLCSLVENRKHDRLNHVREKPKDLNLHAL